MGESFYVDALRSLFPRKLPGGGQELFSRAALVPDPTNPHDRNAVKVIVDGWHVGHLSRGDAAAYQPVLLALVQRGFLPVTAARVWGSEYDNYVGTDRRGRDVVKREFRGSVSLSLDEWHLCVPVNEPPLTPHAMLPYGAALQVHKEENHQDVLRRYAVRQGECWVYGTLHPVVEQTARTSRELVEVRVDGHRVGELTPAMSAEFLPIIARLLEQGRETAARLMVKGNEVRTDAVLHAKKSNQLDDAWLTVNLRQPVRVPQQAVALTQSSASPLASSPLPAAQTAHRSVPMRPSRIVFAPPPGWPSPPPGWEPGPGWRPEPDWPLAPKGGSSGDSRLEVGSAHAHAYRRRAPATCRAM